MVLHLAMSISDEGGEFNGESTQRNLNEHGIALCTILPHPTDSPDSAILALFGMIRDAHVRDAPIPCPTWASQSPRTMMRSVTLFWRHHHHCWVPPHARMCTNCGGCYIVTLWCRAACPTSTVSRTPVRHRSWHATTKPPAGRAPPQRIASPDTAHAPPLPPTDGLLCKYFVSEAVFFFFFF